MKYWIEELILVTLTIVCFVALAAGALVDGVLPWLDRMLN